MNSNGKEELALSRGELIALRDERFAEMQIAARTQRGLMLADFGIDKITARIDELASAGAA